MCRKICQQRLYRPSCMTESIYVPLLFLLVDANDEVRGSRSAKRGGIQQAQLVGCPARLQG